MGEISWWGLLQCDDIKSDVVVSNAPVEDVMQSKRSELKARIELLLKNLEEVTNLIRTRSDLRFITKTLDNVQICENGSISHQQGGQDAGIPSNEEAGRAGSSARISHQRYEVRDDEIRQESRR